MSGAVLHRPSLALPAAGASAASQSAGPAGGQHWTGIDSATGLESASRARLDSLSTSRRDGVLVLDYADYPVDHRYRITAATLTFRLSWDLRELVGANTVELRVVVDGSRTVLETLPDTRQDSAVEKAHTIAEPGGGWTWALVNGIQAEVMGNLAASTEARLLSCWWVSCEVETEKVPVVGTRGRLRAPRR